MVSAVESLRRTFGVAFIVAFVSCVIAAEPSISPWNTAETPFSFEPRTGGPVSAFKGTFEVPENRAEPGSRKLTLHYVRFPATGDSPGAPIVYLAGGPGGSGIWFAKQWRFPLFMAMREFGDVIALDQRGTGASNDAPTCTSSQSIDYAAKMSDQAYINVQQTAFQECLTFWREAQIDLRGYNSRESVADLEALRTHLGVEKLTLWGLSYGSHLAFAAIKVMGSRIERVVIASAEGLDQTIKLPARTDAYFDRLQAAIDTQPAAQAAYPDIKATMRRVHLRLDEQPIALEVPRRDGSSTTVVFQRRDMQRLASAMIADPKRYAMDLIGLYSSLERNDSKPLIPVLQQWLDADGSVAFAAMPVMMDLASGIGSERRKLIDEQAETGLLGPWLNETLYLAEMAPAFDLGDGFRQPPVSDVPLLLLSGTLDGRTYIESQREAVTGFANAQMVTVRNAGHNLLMSSPEVTAVIQEFMRGKNVAGREIEVDLPEFDLVSK